MADLTKTLQERGSRYGSFEMGAIMMQGLKTQMRDAPNWGKLSKDKREALEMIMHKVGRILNRGFLDRHCRLCQFDSRVIKN